MMQQTVMPFSFGLNPWKVMIQGIWAKMDREVLFLECDRLRIDRPDVSLFIVVIGWPICREIYHSS